MEDGAQDDANGEGVAADRAEAVRLCRLAAEQGLAEAQLTLGTAYTEGDGVTPDLVEAGMWLILASAQGEEGAQEAMRSLAARMTKEQAAPRATRRAAAIGGPIERDKLN